MYEYDALDEILLFHVVQCVHNMTSQHVVLLYKIYRFLLLTSLHATLCSCFTSTQPTLAIYKVLCFLQILSSYFLLFDITHHKENVCNYIACYQETLIASKTLIKNCVRTSC